MATERDVQMLMLIGKAGDRGFMPAEFAYAALEAGLLVCRHPRGAWKAQGAGFIGGSELARLERSGFVYSRNRRYVLSLTGKNAIRDAMQIAAQAKENNRE